MRSLIGVELMSRTKDDGSSAFQHRELGPDHLQAVASSTSEIDTDVWPASAMVMDRRTVLRWGSSLICLAMMGRAHILPAFAQAAPTPTELAFSDRTDQYTHIFLRRADGTIGQLTATDADDAQPFWLSRDMLAFVRDTGTARELYAIDSTGENAQRLTARGDTGTIGHPRVSQGRTDAVFAHAGGLVHVSLSSRFARTLTALSSRAADVHPSWDPTGALVAFVRTPLPTAAGEVGVSDLWVVDVSSRQARAITTSAGIHSAEWSPLDGNAIASDDGTYVWLDQLSSGAREILAEGAGGVAWTPDGERLLFGRNNQLIEHHLAGRSERIVAQDLPGTVGTPTVALSGAHVAFTVSN